jgi:D-alanine-D-alanine ligase
MPRLRVAVLANLKKNAPQIPGLAEDVWADLDAEGTPLAIVDALKEGGHDAYFLEGDLSLYDRLRDNRPDICFNICEGHFGDSREAQIPAMLEMLRLPYTGSKTLTQALALDKSMTKRILHWHELPTPDFQTFEEDDEPLEDPIPFPLFVKPSREGTGMGVSARSIVYNDAEMREQIRNINQRYKQPALVERFIEGREVTVGVLGNLVGPAARRIPRDDARVLRGLRLLPPLEVNMGEYGIEEGGVYTHHLKADIPEKLEYLCPAPLTPEQTRELQWLAAAMFRVTGCFDVARVDFRLDKHDNDKAYLLEINPLPGLTPGISDLVMEAEAAGVPYVDLINMILEAAIKRYGQMSLRQLWVPGTAPF